MNRQQLQSISDQLQQFNRWTGRAISWLTLAMVLITFVIVALRYLFDLGWIWMQESVTYLHAVVFMLGAAYTLAEDEHVRVDILYTRFAPRTRAWVNLFGVLFLLVPFCLLILITSWPYVLSAWQIQEGSPQAGGLPAVFLLKSALLLMPVLLLLQGVASLFRQWLEITRTSVDHG